IVGQILLDHSLSYALTTTADVPVVYLQQFWKTVSKLRVETSDNPFVASVNIEIIESFMHMVGYQGVDKVSAFYTKFLAQPWQTMFKVFNCYLTTRTSRHDQTKINILQLFHVVVNRINVDYAALFGWDFNNCNVTVRGMLIPDALLTKEIHATDDYKEYETMFINVAVLMNQPQPHVVEGETDEESYADKFAASMLHDNVDDSRDKIEPESHKEHPEVVVDDDKNKEEKKDDEMGSLENRTEKMQTQILTTPRSPRINLSPDKNIAQELTDTVSLSTATTSKDPHKKTRISSKYSNLPGALRRMCRHQGYMIRDMEHKCVTTDKFWKVHGKVDQVLHEIVPQLAEKATNDLIEENLKRVVADTIILEQDAFQAKVLAHISNEFAAQAPQIIEELFKSYVHNNVIQVHPTITTSTDTTSSADLQQQLYLKMKSNLQDQANDPALDDAFHSQRHDDHQEDDAPLEGEKKVKSHKASKSSKCARVMDDEVILEDTKFQNVDKCVPTIFDRARMEATLNDMLSNQFRNAEEYAYHLEQATNFMENQIVTRFNLTVTCKSKDVKVQVRAASRSGVDEEMRILVVECFFLILQNVVINFALSVKKVPSGRLRASGDYSHHRMVLPELDIVKPVAASALARSSSTSCSVITVLFVRVILPLVILNESRVTTSCYSNDPTLARRVIVSCSADANLACRVSMSSPTDSIRSRGGGGGSSTTCDGGGSTAGGSGSGGGEGDLDLLRDYNGKSDGGGEDDDGKSDGGGEDDDGSNGISLPGR
ncbi:hypothetical protein Tco_0300270, partial [Tanacetum coccineum]